MKKFLGIILLGLLWCNIGYAFNLEQKNYNCLENDTSLKNEIKIIKEYNSRVFTYLRKFWLWRSTFFYES